VDGTPINHEVNNMITNDNIIVCDKCGLELPDTMLWIELSGTYRIDKDYKAIRLDFCDLFCMHDWYNKLDKTNIKPNTNKKKKAKKK